MVPKQANEVEENGKRYSKAKHVWVVVKKRRRMTPVIFLFILKEEEKKKHRPKVWLSFCSQLTVSRMVLNFAREVAASTAKKGVWCEP